MYEISSLLVIFIGFLAMLSTFVIGFFSAVLTFKYVWKPESKVNQKVINELNEEMAKIATSEMFPDEINFDYGLPRELN